MAEFELKEKAILLREEDDVAVLKERLRAGTVLSSNGTSFQLRADINVGHKVALRSIRRGHPVRKYGQIIGFATDDIAVGDWVHTHNLAVGELQQRYEVGTNVRKVDYYPQSQMRYFDGYLRPDGRVGTRNYVAIIPTVNCASTTSQFIKRRVEEFLKDFPNVDGVIALSNKHG